MKPKPLRSLFLAAYLSVISVALADPSPGYYDNATGLTGPQLRAALHEIINDHTIIPYSSTARDSSDALKVLDEDPADTNYVYTLYAQAPRLKSSFGQSTGWNREHLWCNSYGLDDVQPAFSDLHNLRAEDSNVNSARGNKFYDLSNPGDAGFQSPAYTEAPLCSTDSDSWEPPVHVKGDIARAIFYMDVRYEGDRSNEPDLVLTTNLSLIDAAAAYMGNLGVLLQWHNDDPVDAAERLRNDKVDQLYQRNRNPFIDHPEWVYSIYGGEPPAASAPVITSQPQSRSVLAGGSATFVVGASGSNPLSFQWRFNGMNISGATTSAYSRSNVQASDAGNYSVFVSNSLGSVLSADATLTVATAQSGALAEWNFNSNPADTSTGTGSTAPNAGSGAATLVGGTTATFVAGSTSDGATDNSGWNTASYPAQGSGNKTAGVKFSSSTVGYQNITVSWEHRLSNTASKYARLQYSTDGVNFTDHNVIAITTSNAFILQSHDLSAIAGINNNPNFAFRIMAEFESTATGTGTAGYVTSSTSSYGTSGTIRYDLVKVSGSAIPAALPADPADLSAIAGDAQVALSWSVAAGATSYKVKRSTSTGGPYTTLASGVTATSYSDTAVVNGSTYFYVVSAVNSTGESADSNEATATPQLAQPVAPANFSAVAGNNIVDLSWSQSSSPGITQNNLYRSTSGSSGPYGLLANLPASTSYSDNTVVNGNTYFYYVTAINGGGESAASTYRGATPSCPVPAIPSGVAAAAGNAQVSLSWNSVAGAVTYEIKRSTISGGSYAALGSSASAGYTDSTAVNGTTYYYVVSASNACGESANSLQVSATPAAPPALNAPTSLTATPGKKKITLGWRDNSTNESGFRIERSSDGVSFAQIATVGANVQSFANTGLISATRYYYRVRAYNANGNSAYTLIVNAVAQ